MNITLDHTRHLSRSIFEVTGIYKDSKLEGFYWTQHRETILHLQGLVLKSEFQGRRIGTQAFQILEQRHSSNPEAIELGVHQSNQRAKSVYQKLGCKTMRDLPDAGFSIEQRTLHQKS